MSENDLKDTPQQTVFIVDDDEDIRTSLTRALSKRGYNVESHASADEFLKAFDPSRPGCLILDHGMPNMTGLELQDFLVTQNHHVPIIFITGHGGVPESVQAIKAGAIDFLEKPFRQAVLIERIEAAFAADTKRRSEQGATRQIRIRFDNLTDREREIALWIVANPSDASSKEVARQLDISPRTVDHHRARILEKMQVRSIAELVDLALKADLTENSSL